jgi:hypothetical protein
MPRAATLQRTVGAVPLLGGPSTTILPSVVCVITDGFAVLDIRPAIDPLNSR